MLLTLFGLRYSSYKRSIKGYGKGQMGVGGQKLHAHFYTEGHEGLKDLEIQVIDVMDVSQVKFFEKRN